MIEPPAHRGFQCVPRPNSSRKVHRPTPHRIDTSFAYTHLQGFVHIHAQARQFKQLRLRQRATQSTIPRQLRSAAEKPILLYNRRFLLASTFATLSRLRYVWQREPWIARERSITLFLEKWVYTNTIYMCVATRRCLGTRTVVLNRAKDLQTYTHAHTHPQTRID